jgi:small-conductance mechanosensitive channel/tellurite resistance protein
MEFTVQFIQALGLLALLVGAAVVFVHLVTWLAGTKHSQIRIGLEFILLFSVAYFLGAPVLDILGLIEIEADYTKFIAFMWWISLAFTIDALVKRFLWRGVFFHRGECQVPKILRDGAALLLYAIAIMIVMHFIYDKPITAVLATSGAAAFIVGFSAQSMIQDVFAGLALNSTKALKIGDYIEVDGIYGRVTQVNWRSVSLLSPNTGSLYIFPNSTVADKIILNYCEPTELFKHAVTFVVEYRASPELVCRLVMEALEHSRYVVRDPKPDMNVLGFTDLGMEYRVRYYFEGDDPWWDAQNEICGAIWGAMRQHGLRLSIDRHKLQSGDEMEENPWLHEIMAPDDQVHALLAGHAVFSCLPEPALAALATRARLRDYTPPQCIYKEGQESGTIGILAEGRLAVLQTQADGLEAEVGSLSKGAVFGFGETFETGVRRETLQTLEYSRVYEIDAAALAQLSEGTPELAQWIRDYLAGVQQEYAAAAAAHREALAHKEHHRLREDIIRSLKHRVPHVLKPGMMTELLRPITGHHSERVIMEAIMAACALVSAKRGAIDDVERAYVEQILTTLELLHHTDRGTALETFNDFAETISEKPDAGMEAALKAVHRVRDNDKISHIVLGAAHGVTGLHGRVTDDEREAVRRVAEALGLSADASELKASIEMLSAG